MKAARLDAAGRILEIFDTDKAGLADRFAPGLVATWRDVADDASIGDYPDGSPPSPSLDTVKGMARSDVNDGAEAARLKYITQGIGQAIEYKEASEEAARYIATGGAGTYPMLQASVNAGEAENLQAAATLILQREAQCATIFAEIREKRIAAKIAIAAATTADQVRAAAQVTWP